MTTLITPEVETVNETFRTEMTPEVGTFNAVLATTTVDTTGVGTIEAVTTEATPYVANTEVAIAKTQEVSTSADKGQGAKQFLEYQAEQGFEGLELGAFSFDRLILNNGVFQLGQEKEDIGRSVNFVVMSSRAQYIVSRTDDQDDDNVFYSYAADGSTKSDGSSAQETLDEWKEDGYDKPVIKKYLEVMAEIVDDPEREGTMVSISLPPTAQQRFGGVVFQAARRFRANPDGVVITAEVGKTVVVGKKSYNPWSFKISRAL